MDYQSKYDFYICRFFRYLSLVSVMITFIGFVGYIWFRYPNVIFLSKCFATTLGVLLASVVVSIIFYEKTPAKNNALDKSS